jgi:methionyl-tRNA formyltransferase
MRRVPGPVLFLGRDDSLVLAHLHAVEPEVVALAPGEPITPALLDRLDPSFAVSHGYRLIIRPETLARLPDRVINLHISYLPFNRGAHPVLWSVLDGTPSGVTIHHVDERIDTGDIIAQERVELAGDWTFADAYAALQEAIAGLFARTWPAIKAGTSDRRPQVRGGTLHRVADYDAVAHRLPDGWNTRIATLRR